MAAMEREGRSQNQKICPMQEAAPEAQTSRAR
jgi:hypothetical protein